jgi:plasmid stability protein
MPSLNIQLPDALRSRVEARAAESGFDSVEAYVRALLLADAAGGPVIDDDQLEALLLGRLNGPFVEADEADFRQMREKLKARLSRDPGNGAESEPTP